MPYCPNCKTEFQDWCKVCNDCGAALVDEMPIVPPEEYNNKEAFLMAISSSVEADLIESQLRAFGIPVLKKFKGSSGYINVLTGMSNLGVDIYVPQSALESAKEILSATPEPITDYELHGDDNHEQHNQKGLSKVFWAIIISFAVIAIISLLIRF